MILQVCLNGFLKPQTDRKVTWLCDDSQLLSLRTNQSLQRATLILDLFYALPLAGMFVGICVRNSGQDCRRDTGERVVPERWKAADWSASAFS